MRRAFALLLLLSAIPLGAAERWWEAYARGVAAVNARDYKAAIGALEKSIAEQPTEGTSVRAGRQLIVYVPHFWLGIAKFNLGDVDGAMGEWRTSEEQGAIARTEYYARLKDWVARAQAEQSRKAESDAAGSKKSADAAIGRALALQVDALSAGGDRTDSYRAAQDKLRDALSKFHEAGTDIRVYQAAAQTAQQASTLFAAAAEEGKKLKAARPAPPVVKPPPPRSQPVTTSAPAKVDVPPDVPIVSEAEASARLSVQKYRRNVGEAPPAVAASESAVAESLNIALDAAKSDADFDRIAQEAESRDAAMAKRIAALQTRTTTAESKPPTPPLRAGDAELRTAYRAYASGDLLRAEQLLTKIIDAGGSPEAYLLRGCVRYTRAILSRSDALTSAAERDFRAALRGNGSLRLDRATFSPKLVTFFDQVRSAQ